MLHDVNRGLPPGNVQEILVTCWSTAKGAVTPVMMIREQRVVGTTDTLPALTVTAGVQLGRLKVIALGTLTTVKDPAIIVKEVHDKEEENI